MISLCLGWSDVCRIVSGAVKCLDNCGIFEMWQGDLRRLTDAELLKYKYRRGLETLVVYTLNNECQFLKLANARTFCLKSKAARAKFKEIGGSLDKWWNMWFNSIIRGKPYQCTTPN